MAQQEVKTADDFELTEIIDEIEVAKLKRMAIDAQRDHFPTFIYGDQSHVEVLAKALERVCDALEDDQAPEKMEAAKARIEELEVELDELRGTIEQIRDLVAPPPETANKEVVVDEIQAKKLEKQ